MGKKTISLIFEKETKRMVRYWTEEEGWGSIYVPKSIFDDEYPDTLEVVLSW